jgi:nitronate monooxygenase
MDAAKKAGAKVICQIQTVEGALTAAAAGVDAIVAQGTEAGGHTGSNSTLTLLPDVVRAVEPLPVIAAGGIADGRAMAAALILGAEGVWMGTAFLASPQSAYRPNQKRRILEMTAADTILTNVFDIARGNPWPDHIVGRAARNDFVDRWHGREENLKTRQDEATAELNAAVSDDDVDIAPVWAGMGVGLVTGSTDAGEVVQTISADAERILRERSRAVLSDH